MIYHYTNIDTLLKIIESKELFLFNVFNMNDNQEIKWIDHLIDNELKQNKYDESLLKDILETYNFNSSSPAYLCCFSREGDILSQWRSYADNGYGIALGFNEVNLNVKYDIPVTGITSKLSTGLFDCIYDISEQKKLIHDLFVSEFNIFFDNKNDNSNIIINTAITLKKFSLVFKNPAFFEEKEARLIHLPLITSNINNTLKLIGNISDINFMKKGNGISSYFKFPLKDCFSDDLISEIILGPNCMINENDLRLFLTKNNLINTRIFKSKASYRSN